jgi:acetoacetyl-CoA synthetase
MGTSEFYSVLDELESIVDSVVIEVPTQKAPSGMIILIVVPAPGRSVGDGLVAEIEGTLRSELSPRHIPDQILSIDRLPHTRNGKRLEVPLKRCFAGLGTPDSGVVDDVSALNAVANLAESWRKLHQAATPA